MDNVTPGHGAQVAVDNAQPSGGGPTPEPLYDCIVVGSGIGGLTAAWHLRDRSVLVLESDSEVGGRIRSERRGDYWLSVGAHMFPEPHSVVGGLVEEMGLETLVIQGDLLGVFMEGRRLQGGRVEFYPFRLPLERRARTEFIRAGLRMRKAARGYEKLARPRPEDTPAKVRTRLLSFMDDLSFRDFVGPLHPQADAIFTTMSHRMTAEPEEVAAGCIAALFAHVWSSGDVVLGRNMRGGAAELPQALARELGDRLHTNAAVSAVYCDQKCVTVKYRERGADRLAQGRYAIVACPAYATREILRDKSPELTAALEEIKYGPFVVGSFLTKERSAMQWDNLYSLLTPGLSFTMFFNHANVLRTRSGPRQPGGALMVYAGAGAALSLIDKSEADIIDAFTRDLERMFPEMTGIVEDVWIQRWPNAEPFQRPGRSKVQQILETPVGGRVFLAGDYVADWQQMESTASLVREVAVRVRTALREREATSSLARQEGS